MATTIVSPNQGYGLRSLFNYPTTYVYNYTINTSTTTSSNLSWIVDINAPTNPSDLYAPTNLVSVQGVGQSLQVINPSPEYKMQVTCSFTPVLTMTSTSQLSDIAGVSIFDITARTNLRAYNGMYMTTGSAANQYYATTVSTTITLGGSNTVNSVSFTPAVTNIVHTTSPFNILNYSGPTTPYTRCQITITV